MKKARNISLYTITGFLVVSVGLNAHLASSGSSMGMELEKEIIKSDSILAVKLLGDKNIDKQNKLIKASGIEVEALKSNLQTLQVDYNSLQSQLDRTNPTATLLLSNNNSVSTESLNSDLIEHLTASLEQKQYIIRELESELYIAQNQIKGAETIQPIQIEYVPYKICNTSKVRMHNIKKSNLIELSFKLSQNPLAETGNRNVFLVLSDSKGNIYKSVTNNNYSNPMISSGTVTNYSNQGSNVETNLTLNRKLRKDNYRLDIYVDGQMGGHASLDLK